MEEATHGSHSWKQLEEMFDGDWTPARRFCIIQSGKLRVIDDFPENDTNSACACQEKLDLRTLDHLTWCAVRMLTTKMGVKIFYKKKLKEIVDDSIFGSRFWLPHLVVSVALLAQAISVQARVELAW